MDIAGFFTINIYGVLVGLGLLIGFWMVEKMRLRMVGRDATLKKVSAWEALWWVFIPGLLGARLYHVLDLWDYYRENLLLIPAVWTGGLGIFGAIVGGVMGLYFFAVFRQISDSFGVTLSSLKKKRTLNFSQVNRRFLLYLDLVAFGLPVGQAIGRWGNFVNKELYGLPTDLPWGIPISIEHRAKSVEQYTHFHPLFLYESIYSILVFGILLLVWRVKGVKLALGSYFFVYLVLYGFGRFWFEKLRIESWVFAGINIAQFISLLFVFSGVVFLYSTISKRL